MLGQNCGAGCNSPSHEDVTLRKLRLKGLTVYKQINVQLSEKYFSVVFINFCFKSKRRKDCVTLWKASSEECFVQRERFFSGFFFGGGGRGYMCDSEKNL